MSSPRQETRSQPADDGISPVTSATLSEKNFINTDNHGHDHGQPISALPEMVVDSDLIDAGLNGGDQVLNPAPPLFINDLPPAGAIKDDVLFTIPPTDSGPAVKIYVKCGFGNCNCIYTLQDVQSQLRPCRFGYILYGCFLPDAKVHAEMFEGIRYGFPIVDSDVSKYECANYRSILNAYTKPIMDNLVKKEIAEGFISEATQKPKCVHSMGAVPKGSDSIRPITDCSRPLGQSVNNHSISLAKKFWYATIHDVTDLISRGYYLSVIDIQAAYRTVPILPAHRQYLGFQWELDGHQTYYTDNRLCFGLTTGPYYFNSISQFVADVLYYCFGVTIIHYLDDYLVISSDYEGGLYGQKAQ